MAVNTNPRFTGGANAQWTTAVTAANTTKDLTSGTITQIYEAPADGGLVDSIVAVPGGTNVATVARIWLNNGSSTATAANNVMIAQVSLPATSNSESAALPVIVIPIPRALQDIAATHKLYVTLGTAVSAGWQFTAGASKFAAP